MKKITTLIFVGVFLMSFVQLNNVFAQITAIEKPVQNIPVLAFQTPDLTEIHKENALRQKNGSMYRFGVGIDVNVTTKNTGIWLTNDNGDRVWRLKIDYPGAKALSFYFDKFYLYGQSQINVLSAEGKKLHTTYTAKDVQEHGMQNLALCLGDNMMIELIEPKGTQASVLEMNQIMYAYRGVAQAENQNKDFGDSEDCQVNVNCSEGNSWQDEKRGVARILVVAGGAQGWCSGSLVNNTAQDCKPYFLTAMHCGDGSSTANLAQWRFYFKYEASGCSSPSSQGGLASNYITGSLKIAGSNDVSGNNITKSDFLLLKLGSANNESTIINTLKNTYQAHWNGWDANNVTSGSGVSIHHPAGDIKKISTYSSNLQSASYSGVNANTHWVVYWTSTSNGHGVTEGGSSGSPIFNGAGNSRIKGVLSGGSSYCDSPNSPDLYGKVSYSWTSAGTSDATRLKPWLDPTNSGVLVLDGSSDPCSSAPIVPTANFVANQTNVPTGTTVSFTDQSSGSPTSWSWSISPATGWAYSGSSASSQNPQVTFNTVGSYTVSLTATNANGSDVETKNNYIVVTAGSGSGTPCAATSSNCDEYIAQVQLNTLNNSSGCNNYTDYASMSTTLTKGQQFTISVSPQIVGEAIGTAYTDDQIAVWIDFNNNNDFSDAGERVGMATVGSGFTGSFTFTVPSNAATATVRMRVRIIYPGGGMTTISPCGTNADGEVEDYRINLVGVGGPGVGIEDALMNDVVIYPNPVNDELMVNLNNVYQSTNIVVLDVTGKQVLAATHQHVESVQLNMSALSAGVYQVVIETENGKIIRRVSKN